MLLRLDDWAGGWERCPRDDVLPGAGCRARTAWPRLSSVSLVQGVRAVGSLPDQATGIGACVPVAPECSVCVRSMSPDTARHRAGSGRVGVCLCLCVCLHWWLRAVIGLQGQQTRRQGHRRLWRARRRRRLADGELKRALCALFCTTARPETRSRLSTRDRPCGGGNQT